MPPDPKMYYSREFMSAGCVSHPPHLSLDRCVFVSNSFRNFPACFFHLMEIQLVLVQYIANTHMHDLKHVPCD
jgi:hypothetical protein